MSTLPAPGAAWITRSRARAPASAGPVSVATGASVATGVSVAVPASVPVSPVVPRSVTAASAVGVAGSSEQPTSTPPSANITAPIPAKEP